MSNPLAYNPRSQQEACGSVPTDSELAQAYSQGYQDGRRGMDELVDLVMAFEAWLVDDSRSPRRREVCLTECRSAIAKFLQQQNGQAAPDQPATKGE